MTANKFFGAPCELAISIYIILLFTQKLLNEKDSEFAKVFSTKQLSWDVPDLYSNKSEKPWIVNSPLGYA